jgi:hypothetical protein
MPVSCTVILAGLLCLNVPPASNVTVGLSNAEFDSSAGIEGPEFTAGLETFQDVVQQPFNSVGASRACAGDDCLDYKRNCKKVAEATHCSFVLDHGRPIFFHVDADNDIGLQFALNNIAIVFGMKDGASSLPLSALDGKVPTHRPSEKE